MLAHEKPMATKKRNRSTVRLVNPVNNREKTVMTQGVARLSAKADADFVSVVTSEARPTEAVRAAKALYAKLLWERAQR